MHFECLNYKKENFTYSPNMIPIRHIFTNGIIYHINLKLTAYDLSQHSFLIKVIDLLFDTIYLTITHTAQTT